ncbi:MAG: hypothetical protein IKJ26_05775 [Clostridia bacterium]|nr:hypothetical protein [Clostridia bacterium]
MKKRKRIILKIVAAYLLILLFFTACILWRNQQYERTLRPFVKGGYTQSGVSLPNDPHYVLLNENKFQVPASNLFSGKARSPKEVNVIVSCFEGSERIGTAVNTQGGMRAGVAYTEYVDVSIIRLEDWALVSRQRVYAEQDKLEKMDVRYTYTMNVAGHEVAKYLNTLMP